MGTTVFFFFALIKFHPPAVGCFLLDTLSNDCSPDCFFFFIEHMLCKEHRTSVPSSTTDRTLFSTLDKYTLVCFQVPWYLCWLFVSGALPPVFLCLSALAFLNSCAFTTDLRIDLATCKNAC